MSTINIKQSDIPDGWVKCNFPDFVHLEMGQSPPSTTYNHEKKGLPFFQGKAEFGELYPTVDKYCSAPNKIAKEGAVLLTVRAPVGPTNLANVDCCIGRGLAGIHPLDEIGSKFLLFLMRSVESEISGQGTGSTFGAINKNFLEELVFALPPLNEQKRIVAKIEELFSELDKGMESLKTARAQLTIYRQAILKQAFEGKLTQKWREDNKANLLVSDEILKNIPKERTKKLSSPSKEEMKSFDDLPQEWQYSRLGCFIDNINAGKSFKCDEREPLSNEVGVAKVSAVTWGEYDEHESKTCTDPKKINPSYYIKENDFLFSRANTIELVGACVIVKEVSKNIMLSDKTLRIVFDKINPYFFLHYLRSHTGRNEIMKRSTGNQDSMRNIGQERIKNIVLPICSPEEAEEIIRVIEEKISGIDKVEEEIEYQLKKSEILRQSILKQAFSGKLVAPDPADEPASVLLERIKAEKQSSAKSKKKKRKAA